MDTCCIDVVLSGSFHHDIIGLRKSFDELVSAGCNVLSPSSVDVESEQDGFVFMRGDGVKSVPQIVKRHLSAIEMAQFIWLHAPEGYVGLSAAMEIGFASACGVPVFTSSELTDATLTQLVIRVPSVLYAVEHTRRVGQPVPMSLPAIQRWYQYIAKNRGFDKEDARDCLLLMVEEVGELARSIRKRTGIARHQKDAPNYGLELADVFLYIIHLANILGINLMSMTTSKEAINSKRFMELK